jgi:invasion protein IalB
MTHRHFFTAAKASALAGMAVVIAFGLASQSSAQQPPPQKGTPQKGAPQKGTPQKGAAQKGGTPPPQAQPEQPKIDFSPWTKVCPKGQDANAKAVCLTGKDGLVETGMPVVAAVLIEPEGEPRKVLRVTLPLGMALQPGTRVVIDQGQPMTAPYVMCVPSGCMADYEASGELIANLKKGKGLAVQGMNGSGQPLTLVLPLADFAKAHDSAPTDPETFRKMQQDRFEKHQKNKPSQ